MTSMTGFGGGAPKGYRTGQLQQYGPQEMQLYNQLRGLAGPNSNLSRLAGGDEAAFEQIEAPFHRQFAEQLGNIGSRFSQMGTGGRHGSGFHNYTTAAASNFSQDLAANRQGLQRQAMKDLQDLIDQLLGRNKPTQNYLVPKREKQSSGWGGVAGGIGGGLLGLGLSGGNPASALKFGQLGYNIGSGF